MPIEKPRPGVPWKVVEVDERLEPCVDYISSRGVDLTSTFDNHWNAPHKYVWVKRFRHPEDRPMPSGCDEVQVMHSHLEHFITTIRFSPLTRPSRAVVPYVRWELPPDKKVIEGLFEEIELPVEYQAYLHKHRRPLIDRHLHPVFAEAHNGGPYGRWAFDLCKRDSRKTGFFVQLFGNMNEVPCQCCFDTYRRSVTELKDRRSGTKKEIHAMWPFFGCVSMGEEFQNGKCGNCWWTEKRCSWELVDGGGRDPFSQRKTPFVLGQPGKQVQLATWTYGQALVVDLEQAISDQMAKFRERRAQDQRRRK